MEAIFSDLFCLRAVNFCAYSNAINVQFQFLFIGEKMASEFEKLKKNLKFFSVFSRFFGATMKFLRNFTYFRNFFEISAKKKIFFFVAKSISGMDVR